MKARIHAGLQGIVKMEETENFRETSGNSLPAEQASKGFPAVSFLENSPVKFPLPPLWGEETGNFLKGNMMNLPLREQWEDQGPVA